MRLAFFDTKPYDKASFNKYAEGKDITIKYFETKLNEDTVDLASGYDAVCVFVNDIVNAKVIDRLVELGVGVVALVAMLPLLRTTTVWPLVFVTRMSPLPR